MSLILDALKKSEAERQRGQVPNLLSPSPAATRQYNTQKKSSLPWIISTTILLAVLVFGYLSMKSADRAVPDISGTITTTGSQPAEASTKTTEPAPSVTVPAAVMPTVAQTPVTAPANAAGQAPQIKPLSPFTQTAEEPSRPAVETVDSLPEKRIAGMAEMPVDQRQQLPALKLSMHVYSSESAKRFAIIDGQRVNEGSLVGAAVVEEIRQDGVVLSLQGQSYLLPRP